MYRSANSSPRNPGRINGKKKGKKSKGNQAEENLAKMLHAYTESLHKLQAQRPDTQNSALAGNLGLLKAQLAQVMEEKNDLNRKFIESRKALQSTGELLLKVHNHTIELKAERDEHKSKLEGLSVLNKTLNEKVIEMTSKIEETNNNVDKSLNTANITEFVEKILAVKEDHIIAIEKQQHELQTEMSKLRKENNKLTELQQEQQDIIQTTKLKIASLERVAAIERTASMERIETLEKGRLEDLKKIARVTENISNRQPSAEKPSNSNFSPRKTVNTPTQSQYHTIVDQQQSPQYSMMQQHSSHNIITPIQQQHPKEYITNYPSSTQQQQQQQQQQDTLQVSTSRKSHRQNSSEEADHHNNNNNSLSIITNPTNMKTMESHNESPNKDLGPISFKQPGENIEHEFVKQQSNTNSSQVLLAKSINNKNKITTSNNNGEIIKRKQSLMDRAVNQVLWPGSLSGGGASKIDVNISNNNEDNTPEGGIIRPSSPLVRLADIAKRYGDISWKTAFIKLPNENENDFKTRLLQHKKALKRDIFSWSKSFVVEYKRAPTKDDKKSYGPEVFKVYNLLGKIMRDAGMAGADD